MYLCKETEMEKKSTLAENLKVLLFCYQPK